MTASCLDLLGSELGPLKQAEAAGRLVPQARGSPCWMLTPARQSAGRREVFEAVKASCKQEVFRAIAGTGEGAVLERPGLRAVHAQVSPMMARGASCLGVFLRHCLVMQLLPDPVGARAQELALLAALEQACEALLARCFENYSSLAEAAPGGIVEGGQAPPELPAPALLPAVELCSAPLSRLSASARREAAPPGGVRARPAPRHLALLRTGTGSAGMRRRMTAL